MILIKNSFVVDGTGSPGEKKDILLKDNRIVAIGDLGSKSADRVIDGLGLLAVPGFIDINTDSDHYLSLFTDPLQQDFLLQGVTTIIGGHCGSSLAPLIQGTLESVRKWGDVNWNTVKEFLAVREKRRLGVNFGTLVGHSTIRRSLLGQAIRDLTEGELATLAALVRQALAEGALGLSTGLGYNHARQTPMLEISRLLDVVKEMGGVYTTHLRNEREGIVDAVAETITASEAAGVPTIISHFRPIKGYEQQFATALRLIEETSGLVRFDGYPFDYSMMPVYTLLPEWAQIGTIETMLATLAEHDQHELFASFSQFTGDDLVIARAPGFDYLVGKTLKEYAASQEVTTPEGLLHLMKVTGLRAVLFHKNINVEVMLRALESEAAFVASNSPSLIESRNVIENERAAKTFSRFLKYAESSGKGIEWAVHKVTQEPAQKFKLKDRGVLKEGMIADVALLSIKDQRASHVFVGGAAVVSDGVIQEVYNGIILRHER